MSTKYSCLYLSIWNSGYVYIIDQINHIAHHLYATFDINSSFITSLWLRHSILPLRHQIRGKNTTKNAEDHILKVKMLIIAQS